jgi:hypothetical protein
MHLLNTLPQRLDPGATPTFAGLIAPSLTSPASTNLTLAGGAGNSSIILTPAGTGNVGIGTTTPNRKLEVFKDLATNTLGSGEVLRILADDGNTAGRVTELGFGTGPTGATFAPALIGVANISVSGYGTKDLYFATRSGISDVAPTERMRIKSGGDVTIASSTAGSSGAGALVVTGGLSAGNNGNASYIGGHLTLGGGSAELRAGTASTFGAFGNSDVSAYLLFYGSTHGTFPSQLQFNSAGSVALRINGTAATFAGAVAIGNTVSSVSPTSPNRTITMVVGGVTLYIAAKTTND